MSQLAQRSLSVRSRFAFVFAFATFSFHFKFSRFFFACVLTSSRSFIEGSNFLKFQAAKNNDNNDVLKTLWETFYRLRCFLLFCQLCAWKSFVANRFRVKSKLYFYYTDIKMFTALNVGVNRTFPLIKVQCMCGKVKVKTYSTCFRF